MCQILDGMTFGAATAADKLLFISSQSRKFLCKQHSAGTPSSAALPVCEFKLGPMLPSFSTITSRSAGNSSPERKNCVANLVPDCTAIQEL